MKQYTIYLASGLTFTLVLLLLSGSLLDAMFAGQTEFANEMYNQNLYLTTSLFSAAIAWGLAGVFYYVVNSVSFSRWYHWLIVLGAAALGSWCATYTYCYGIFEENGLEFGSELFGYSLFQLIFSVIFFTVASYSIRWWSSNCRHTPIPE